MLSDDCDQAGLGHFGPIVLVVVPERKYDLAARYIPLESTGIMESNILTLFWYMRSHNVHDL